MARYDYNLVILGGGAAGLSCAYLAALLQARVALVERAHMGGDCLNTGCVPSKALIRTARFLADCKRAQQFGCKAVQPEFDFAEIMARVRRVIARIQPHDSVERYSALGVECLRGEAHLRSPHEVAVDGRLLRTRSILLATGAQPRHPKLPGLDKVPFLDSETVWELQEAPRRLVVLGGGPIGCELGQCFTRLGSEVHIVELQNHLLAGEDEDCARLVEERLRREGTFLHTGFAALRCEPAPHGGGTLVAQSRETGTATGAQTLELPFDQLLIAVGRSARTQGLGLEEVGVQLNPQGTVRVDKRLRTSCRSIYACGDVCGPYQYTHAASHQAAYATLNALFGLPFAKVNYEHLPHATYTDPEVARVGLNEQEAQRQNLPYETARYDLSELDRAIADEAAEGLVKLILKPGGKRILGATVVGPQAAELLMEFVIARQHGLSPYKLLRTIHPYPSLAEACKYAVSKSSVGQVSERLRPWLRRIQGFLR